MLLIFIYLSINIKKQIPQIMQNRIFTQLKGRRLFPILLLFICIKEERFYIHNFTSSFLLPKDAIIILSFISKIISGALLSGLNPSSDDSHIKTNTCNSIVSTFSSLSYLFYFYSTLVGFFFPLLRCFLSVNLVKAVRDSSSFLN